MALNDVSLPKQYKNGRVLFEENLDDWRLAAEDAFSDILLNLTQIGKDLSGTTYNFSNNGNQSISPSLQEQITAFTSGSAPITGTSSDTFTINSDAFGVILNSAGLTASHIYTFPDTAGVLVTDTSTQTISNKTFGTDIIGINGADINIYSDASVTLKFKVDGATGNFGMVQGGTFYLNDTTLSSVNAVTMSASATQFTFNAYGTTPYIINNSSFVVGANHNFGVTSGKKLNVDGSVGSYYLSLSGGVFTIFAGGSQRINLAATTTTIINATTFIVQNMDMILTGTKKLFLDGGVNTSIRESSGDVLTFEAGGADSMSITATGLGVVATNQIFLDGVAQTGDTSIRESAANIIMNKTGGTDRFSIASGGIGIVATAEIFLDGVSQTGDTSIRESAANTMAFKAGGTDVVSITATAVTTTKDLVISGALSDLAVGSGLIYFGSLGGNSSILLNTAGNDDFEFQINGNFVISFDDPAGIAASETTIFLVWSNAGTPTTARVLVGAAGSGPGGAGKALYIA